MNFDNSSSLEKVIESSFSGLLKNNALHYEIIDPYCAFFYNNLFVLQIVGDRDGFSQNYIYRKATNEFRQIDLKPLYFERAFDNVKDNFFGLPEFKDRHERDLKRIAFVWEYYFGDVLSGESNWINEKKMPQTPSARQLAFARKCNLKIIN